MAGNIGAFEEAVYGLKPDPKSLLHSGEDATVAALTATGAIKGVSGTDTSTVHAAHVDAQAGLITTESLNTAAQGEYTLTLTNSFVSATSKVFAWIQGGTNTEQALFKKSVPGSGTVDLIFVNTEASDALDGTLIIGFLVIP